MSFAEMTQNRARLRRKFDHQGEREPPAGAKKLGFEALLKGFLKGFRFKKCDFFRACGALLTTRMVKFAPQARKNRIF